ncbi:MAG: hypothetical protein AB7P99_04010 [Vicinamibacterales bacterium]
MSLLLITGAAFAALFVFGLLAIGFLFKLVFWLVFLPFRLLFKLLFGLGGLVVGIVAVPLLLLLVVGGLILAVIAALVSLLLPLLPVILLGLVGWALFKGRGPRPQAPSPTYQTPA